MKQYLMEKTRELASLTSIPEQTFYEDSNCIKMAACYAQYKLEQENTIKVFCSSCRGTGFDLNRTTIGARCLDCRGFGFRPYTLEEIITKAQERRCDGS